MGTGGTGILDALGPGVLVLADRNFPGVDIQSAGRHQAFCHRERALRVPCAPCSRPTRRHASWTALVLLAVPPTVIHGAPAVRRWTSAPRTGGCGEGGMPVRVAGKWLVRRDEFDPLIQGSLTGGWSRALRRAVARLCRYGRLPGGTRATRDGSPGGVPRPRSAPPWRPWTSRHRTGLRVRLSPWAVRPVARRCARVAEQDCSNPRLQPNDS